MLTEKLFSNLREKLPRTLDFTKELAMWGRDWCKKSKSKCKSLNEKSLHWKDTFSKMENPVGIFASICKQ